MFEECLRIGNAAKSKHLCMVLSIGPCVILSMLYRTLREVGANVQVTRALIQALWLRYCDFH